MATDFDSTPNYTANIQGGQGRPLSPPDQKRGLFGIKKKSNSNLAQAPQPPTLTSDGGNGSVESFNGSETSSGKKKKVAVKNVFSRRNRNDSAATMPVGYEDRRRQAEDDESVASYESDPETTPKLRPKSSGYLSAKSASSNASSNLPPPTVSNKKSGFFRRSTSPSHMDSVSPPNRSSTTAQAPIEQTPTQLDQTQTPGPEVRVDDTILRGQEGSYHSPHSSSSSKSSRRRAGSLTVPKVNTTPDLSTAPQITATPPTPIEGSSEFAPATSGNSGPQRARATSTSKNPSKLSQSTIPSPSPPIVRGPESDKENSNASPNSKQAGGFFQSMFSAAQNAATTITNNIPLNLPNQDRNTPRLGNDENSQSPDLADRAEPGPQDGQDDREPAIRTLGSGELSLEALGITAEPEPRATRAGTTVGGSSNRPVNSSQGDVSQYHLDKSQTLPVSGYGASGLENAGDLSQARTPMAEDTVVLAPRATTSAGDTTPDRRSISGIDDTDFTERKRAASVRSSGAASETRRRHRGSSAASQPNGMHLIPRPTGFAVATKKRNRDFHNLFRSVPEDDYLIEDYGCALQKEILLQGRFYVSEGHICFYSNILGWVTQLVISFDEVVSVEKKSTALLFPNGLVIQTLHARHTFASFITRDATYDLIIGLWNVGHPGLVQTPGEAHLTGVGNDGNESDVEEDEYEDETDDLEDAFTDAGDGEHEDGEASLTPVKNPSRKASQQVLAGPASSAGSAGGTDDFPGPATHAPTVCGDEANHYDKPLCNEVFPVPLGKIYSLLFGPQSFGFMSRVLTDEEKVLELSIPNNGLYADEGGKKTRQYTYIKPLSGPIGPKQTKCIITETIDSENLEDHVTVTVSTQTPDVPSGGVFLVKTKYCLMWAENNSTRLIMNCTVEWSGKSWIKGPVEKGASEGQVGFTKSLLTCLRSEIAPKRPAGAVVKGGKGKARRRKDGKIAVKAIVEERTPAAVAQATSWGLFEPIKPILSPVTDMISPLLPANFTNIVLWILVIWLLLGKFQQGGKDLVVNRSGPSDWEVNWGNTEAEFWDWLEDRSGLNELPLGDSHHRDRAFQKVLTQKTAAKGLKDHQLREAISVMEERLESLKRISTEQGRLKDDDEDTRESRKA